MSRKLEDLLPQTRDKVERLLKLAEEAGAPIFITSTFRSFEEQQALFEQGRTAPGKIVTYAQPGESFHNVRRAADFAFKVPKGEDIYQGPWALIGSLAEQVGLTWGGRWSGKKRDRPHVEDRECVRCGTHRSATSFDESGACNLLVLPK